MGIIKNMKTWKTIIQFCITVLTAIVSSFFVQSCHTDLTDPTDPNNHTGCTSLTDPTDIDSCYSWSENKSVRSVRSV